MLEVTQRAVRLREIPQGRPAGLDRLVKHRLNGLGEPNRPRAPNPACFPLWAELGAEKRFTHIDVAKPRNYALIQKRRLEVGPTPLKRGG